MKKLLIVALLATTGLAFAEGNSWETRSPEQKRDMRPQEHVFRGYDRDHRPHPRAVWRDDTGWVLPALVFGGLLGAAVASQPPVVVPPVVVQPEPFYTVPTPTYRYVQAYDESCRCWKQVLIQN